MVNLQKILQKAIIDFPIGTEFISVYNNKDKTTSLPYIFANKNISVNADNRVRILYENKIWGTIISKPEVLESIIDNFEIWN